MSIRHPCSYVAAGALIVCFATAASETAHAQVSILKECGAQFQAAKAEGASKGQGWQDFLRLCRTCLAEQPPPAVASATSDRMNAQSTVLKKCGMQYQTAKASNKLGGQGWQDFLNACRTRLAEQPAPEQPPAAEELAPAAAPAPAPAATPIIPSQPAAETVAPIPVPTTAPSITPSKPVSAYKTVERSRKKWCVAEWKAQKAELKKTSPDLKWPQYWNECNKRLKASLQ